MKCKRCLNDNTVRNIKFNEEGICNFCIEYEKIAPQITDYTKLSKLFEERIELVRGQYDYDVALGISGGKDSVFVLYELIHKYKLKVKTFTINNGFLSSVAKENIDKIVKEFNIEHEYIEFDSDILKKFYNYSMKHFLVPCIACSYMGYAAMINYTVKINAGICIHGRSPEQMFRCYGKDVFTKFVDIGLKNVNEVNVDVEYKNILDDISKKLDKTISKEVTNILYDGIEEKSFREFVGYFLYHKYDETEIVEFLKSNTRWEPPKEYNHYDCEIHNAAKYIYQIAEGRAHKLPETSVLVREKILTREEGEKLLANEIIAKPKDELNKLCRYAKINKFSLFIKAKIYNWSLKK